MLADGSEFCLPSVSLNDFSNLSRLYWIFQFINSPIDRLIANWKQKREQRTQRKMQNGSRAQKKGSAIQNSLCILLLPLERKRDSNTGSERERTKDAIIKIKPATNLRNQLEIIYMFIRNWNNKRSRATFFHSPPHDDSDICALKKNLYRKKIQKYPSFIYMIQIYNFIRNLCIIWI